MKISNTKFKIIFILIFFALFGLAKSSWAADSLITSNPFTLQTYLGAFTVPGSAGYMTMTPVFNPNGNGGAGSLFVNSLFNSGHEVAEISIPSLYTGTNISTLNQSQYTASFLQNFSDITEGHDGGTANVGVGGASCSTGIFYRICGMYLNGTSLMATLDDMYDAASPPCQQLTLFSHSTNLSATGSFSGYYGVTSTGFTNNGGTPGGFTGGAMAPVPAAYQSQLGGTVLVSGNFLDRSIIGASSVGPTLTAFNPSNLSLNNDVSGNFLVGYPADHQTLGQWNTFPSGNNPGGYNNYYSSVDHYTGVIFPTNSRSVMVVGMHGNGNPGLDCNSSNGYSGPAGPGIGGYGFGTNVCSQICYSDGIHTPQCSGSPHTCGNTTTNDACLYDPSSATTQSSAGPHAWPYTPYVWAYDVGDSSGNNTSGNAVSSMNATHPEKNNLTAVKLGQVNPWDLYPYAMWVLPSTWGGGGGSSGQYYGAAYDPVAGKAYFPIYEGNSDANQPIFEVWQVAAGSSGDTTPPAAPSGLSVW